MEVSYKTATRNANTMQYVLNDFTMAKVFSKVLVLRVSPLLTNHESHTVLCALIK